ncbi:MAG: DNA/RNA nuclease SfsA [Acidobacteria bacterium]|nr:DNA/RNA nuclease SfsA [Acidobacteriota bacterium]
MRFRNGAAEGIAHLANPGRLAEVLLPGTELLLERCPQNRIGWKVIGATWSARWPGDRPRIVYLDATRMNRLAERLIAQGLIPELRGYQIDKREVADGGSRFDFLLRSGRCCFLLEVKSVTLAERGLAFFPDARTERGRRHLQELARHGGRPGHRTGVLFLVQGAVDRFLPDFHNDLEFARTFRAVRRRVEFLAYRIDPALGGDGCLAFTRPPTRLRVPWRLLDAGVRDAGLYMLVLQLPQQTCVEVGGLGPRTFRSGFYVYTGSARRGLGARIARHLRRRKRFHWHIDFLRAHSSQVRAFPIRAASDECELAAEVARIGGELVADFGASDCRCAGHLAWFPEIPVHTAAFQELLTRMRHMPGAANSSSGRPPGTDRSAGSAPTTGG